MRQARAAQITPASSVTEFERWTRPISRHSSASTPVSSRSSRATPSSGVSPAGDAAFGDLPRVCVERVAVLADEQDAIVVVEDDDARPRGSRSGRRRRSPGRRRAGSTTSCQTVIQSFSYATRREWRVHGPIVDRSSSLRGPSLIAGHRRTAPSGRARRGRPALSSADGVTTGADAARPASPPRPRGRDAPRRPDPGQRRRRAVGEPLAAGAAGRRRRTQRFPAILEMIPYRKDDWRAASDESRGEWLAARGYALCRLDVRGTGLAPASRSTSTPPARRTTATRRSSGSRPSRGPTATVGMWGISYGGFTSIQVAKLRPPHLRGDRPDDGDRRPLHRRRPLPRRLRDGVGAVASTRSAWSG